jgi:hypothetical protein
MHAAMPTNEVIKKIESFTAKVSVRACRVSLATRHNVLQEWAHLVHARACPTAPPATA